jgi:predicted Zn finger-like uncharacterized protein
MLVSCPACKTRYRYAEQKVGGRAIRIRCCNCRQLFRIHEKTGADSFLAAAESITVLVAHESPAFCETIRQVLAPEPFTLLVCHDGKEAVSLIQRFLPTVVLLDVALPSLFGFQVCEAVRNDPRTAHVKIILLAAIYDKTKYKRAPQSLYGADDYIEKHHIPDSLAPLIYRLAAEAKPVDSLAVDDPDIPTALESPSAGETREQEDARQSLRRDELRGIVPSPDDSLAEGHEAARHLARSIIADIALYRELEVNEGMRRSAGRAMLADELADGQRLYESRVPAAVRANTDYFSKAVTELLGQRAGAEGTRERSAVDLMEKLIHQLESNVEEERRQAVVALGRLPFSGVKHLLYLALGDDSWRVRKEAVDAVLAAAPATEAIEELVDLLLVSENAGLRNAAVDILQSLGEQALPFLYRRLVHEDAGVRKFVVDILGGIGATAAVPKLLPVLDDTDPNVAAAAAESLGNIAAAEAVPVLIRSLAKEDLLFRYSVLEALKKIGKPVPLSVLAPLANLPLLRKAVFDCLRSIGTVEAVPLLIEGLSERARNVREAAMLAVATIYQRSVGKETAGMSSATRQTGRLPGGR